MKDDRTQLSSGLPEWSAFCMAWRGIGYAVAVAGVLALLVATSGSQALRHGDQVQSMTAGLSPSSYTSTVALHVREQQDQTFLFHPLDPLGERFASFAILTGDVGPARGLGRCDRKSACHYSVAMAENAVSEAADAKVGGTDAVASYRSACAAKDMSAMARIEQLGFSDEVPSEKLAAASIMLLTARANCARGRITEAFEQYENLLADTVASDTSK